MVTLYHTTRALEFVHAFLDSVLTGEENLTVCANIAYEKSLKRYHGWIVRGIFRCKYISCSRAVVEHFGVKEIYRTVSIWDLGKCFVERTELEMTVTH